MGTKSEISFEKRVPVEFRETIWCNRFVRVWRMQHRWEHNLKKIWKLFLRSLNYIRPIVKCAIQTLRIRKIRLSNNITFQLYIEAVKIIRGINYFAQQTFNICISLLADRNQGETMPQCYQVWHTVCNIRQYNKFSNASFQWRYLYRAVS